MDIAREIAKQVESLPPDLQEQVLQFITSLGAPPKTGEPGSRLRAFSSLLDPESAEQMTAAIEEECEPIDARAW